MRPDAAHKHGVPVEQHVLGRHRGGHPALGRSLDEGHRLGRGDVLHHHPQAGHTLQQRCQDGVQEPGLSVENVNLWAGHLAVDQQRHAVRRHGLQHPSHLASHTTARDERRLGKWQGAWESAAHTLLTSDTPSALLVVAPAG